MKTFAPLAALVLALGLACAGGSDSAVNGAVDAEVTPPPEPAAPVAVEGEQGQDVVVVPVPDEGTGAHWCCEFNEDGVTKYALSESKAACESTFGTKGARWMDGAQCIPCCCKSPNDEGNLDLGYTFGLTTPSGCAGSGECVPMGEDTCDADDEDDDKAEPRPAPKPARGHVTGTRPPTPTPAPKDKK